MVIGRFAGWLKGMAVGAAVAALVAVPMVGQGAGIVGVNDLAYAGGGCTGKVPSRTSISPR